MKKTLLVGIIFGMLTLLGGCGNSSYNKFMEEGKLALASKEYEQAVNMFKLAYDEKDNREAESLIKQTEGFIELENLKMEEPVDVIVEKCDEILSYESKTTYVIDEVNAIKEEYSIKLDEVIKNREALNQRMSDIESNYINNEQFEESIDLLEQIRCELKPYIDVELDINYANEYERCKELIDKCETVISTRKEYDRNQENLTDFEDKGFTAEKAIDYAMNEYQEKKDHFVVMGTSFKNGKGCYEIQVKAETTDGVLSTAFIIYVFEDGTVLDQFEVS